MAARANGSQRAIQKQSCGNGPTPAPAHNATTGWAPRGVCSGPPGRAGRAWRQQRQRPCGGGGLAVALGVPCGEAAAPVVHLHTCRRSSSVRGGGQRARRPLLTRSCRRGAPPTAYGVTRSWQSFHWCWDSQTRRASTGGALVGRLMRYAPRLRPLHLTCGEPG